MDARQSGMGPVDGRRRELEERTCRNLNREETKGHFLQVQRSLREIAE